MTEKQNQSGLASHSGDIDTSWQYTRCPECQAVFRVDHNKLVVRQGEVRCGACRGVFHAPSHKVFRNHGGGFSALIAESTETVGATLEPVTPGTNLNVDSDTPAGDPFSATFTTSIDSVSESKVLFSEEKKSSDIDETGDGSSRLFSTSVGQEDVDLTANEILDGNKEEIVIPKISSEPLVNRSLAEEEEYRREPQISMTRGDVEEPEKHVHSQLNQEEIKAAREELIFQPLSQYNNEDEEKKQSLNDSGANSASELPATYSSKVLQEGAKWSDANVQPYGASAMPMPPSFEPFAPNSPFVSEPESNAEVDSGQWPAKEDSLLDHNPFSLKEEKPAYSAPEIKLEPRPAAINMSGVDEYIVDRPNPLAGFFWFLVSAAFVVLLGLQVKYFLVERFAQNEAYRPYLQIFCGIARCELSPRRDAYRFTITQTRVDLHPREPGALRITVRLLNQAKFAQPYPDLRLTLTDRVGRVVGRRKFDPDFYLPKGAATRLAPGELGYVVFDLARPHEKAVGFVVDVVRRSS